jgi:hypothetical protein
MRGVTGLNIWSIIVSVIGAVVVLWVYEKLVATTAEKHALRPAARLTRAAAGYCVDFVK